MASSQLVCVLNRYFAQSLEIKKKNNARALYGLAQCCDAMSGDKAANKPVTEALHNYARNELSSLYANNTMSGAMEKLMETQTQTLSE